MGKRWTAFCIALSIFAIPLIACNLGTVGPTQQSALPTQTNFVPIQQTALGTESVLSSSNQSSALPQNGTQAPITTCTVRGDWPIYTVVEGDTLNGLAQRIQSSADELSKGNCLSNENAIVVGQQLHIPRIPTAVGNPLMMLRSSGTFIGGDLWTWGLADNKPRQATNWGYNQEPIISPDGKWVAYLSVAQAAVNVIKKTGAGQGLPPANIWIINPQTGNAIRIADQPANVPFEQLISRPNWPDWSPDGSALAWIEFANQQERIAIYNLGSKNTSFIPLNLPSLCCGDVLSRSVKWGQPGIAVLGYEGPSPDKTQLVIRLYNPLGTLLSTVMPGRYTVRDWITDSGNWYLSAQDDTNKWYLLDPMSGQLAVMPGEPELYSLSAPNGATASPDDAPNAGRTHWKLRFSHSEVPLDDISAWDGVAISADGQYIACQEGLEGATPTIKVYGDAKQVISVPITDTFPMLVWGPVAWRVRHNP